MPTQLSKVADYLITALEKLEKQEEKGKLHVNPLVSKVATLYEKLRNAMDYREEEVVLRAAIERILKRRIILGGKGKTVAEPLVRELVWARYFPENSVSEENIHKIGNTIDLYLQLRHEVLTIHSLSEKMVTEWMYQLMSSHIEKMVHPNKEKEYIANFMFHVLKNQVTITDDSEQTKDAQVFIAVRKSFAKDDIAFLRYHLFTQYFGELSVDSVHDVAASFKDGYQEIEKEFAYPRKERLFSYVKSKTGVFFILEDIFRAYGGAIRELVTNEEELKKAIFQACEARYSGISSKIRRAIIRSVIFILLTKVFFAFAVEGTIETILYGRAQWNAILVNTSIPPLLMIIVSFFIRTPGLDNSERIFSYMKTLLFDETASLGATLSLSKTPPKNRPFLNSIFTLLWFLAFVFTFGGIVYILTIFGFHPVSQIIFLFFVTIVSFLTYRIGNMSKEYTVDERPGILTPIMDFAFMPVIRVGRHLTEGISQINIFLFIFDFLIETPFKGLFSFFEQWFFFLHTKREELE